METKKRGYGLNVGASSILVIIVILSLVCFAGLSITSANADYRLSERLAQRTTAYYQACNEAQRQLSQLSSSLSELYASSKNQTDYEEKIKESLTDSLTFSYSITDNQLLQVSVTPLYPKDPTGNLYEITCWQVVNIISPELDESLPVFLGN